MNNDASLLSVLLIEDDLVDEIATLRTVAGEALPYSVQVARTTAQARALLAQQSFDVILADYQLPDGTSFDLMDAFADQLVIFVTGAWDEAVAARALRLGVHDYLIKDHDSKYLKLLHYRVSTALRLRHSARQLRESEARLQAILDHAPACISARDLSGRVILSNRRHAAIAGAATLAGDGLETSEAEETLTHLDGSRHTYLTVRFPMPDADCHGLAVGTISVDITARKEAEEQVRNLAFFDPLTGLPNRRLLMDRLKQAFATTARHGGHGAVFFIDLDHFKSLNDTLGHDHGDMLLVEVGRRLLGCVRGEDTVARMGGDEFVVMALSLADDKRAAAEQARLVGDKIMEAIAGPCQLGLHVHRVTPSVGISLFRDSEPTLDDVLKRADLAMYQAKAAGRGTLRFFDTVMQADIDTRQALERDLRRAVQAGQLQLLFQGQIDNARGAVGAEALLRWCHPQLGMLLPDQFVPLAEQNGLILSIGQWVIEAACAQLGTWAASPALCHLNLAVNISARQFREAGFVDFVVKALGEQRIEPGRLRLEMREAPDPDHAEQTLACMQALKAHGVGFAMEDFGIGYSSLRQLERLPLDQIKISRLLIPSMASDGHDAALVKTIIGIGRELGLSVLAAGVETEQQQECLLELGCSLWQGYLFGRPSSLAEFEGLLGAAPYALVPLPGRAA